MPSLYNFSAGPAMLPHSVLATAQAELRDFAGTGMSVMEMSHRSAEFMAIAAQAKADLIRLLKIPANYQVLFLQGGATTQFALLPQNLASSKQMIDYVNTGVWSKKAIANAAAVNPVNIVASSEDDHYHCIPELSTWQFSEQAAYLHYTDNETIGGLEFPSCPNIPDEVPIVCDMSSNLLSKQIDVNRYGVVYAGAQKNIGPAGLTIVIIREDLLTRVSDQVPPILRYATQAQADSMSNTPPTYSWYIAGLVFKWLLQEGGVTVIEKRNQQKASLLYDTIDQSDFYHNPIDPQSRSMMNVPFTLADASREQDILARASNAGLINLKGHRSVGGLRASIYNAMPLSGVSALVDFLQDYEKNHA